MTDGLDDADIVSGLRAGDRDAWSALCQAYGERLWRYVARLVGSDEDGVAEVFQETLLAVAKSGRAIRADTTLWPWLSRIGHNQAALFWRNRYRDRSAEHAAVESLTSADGDPLASLTQMETVESVRVLLAEMNADHVALLTAKIGPRVALEFLIERFETYPERFDYTYEAPWRRFSSQLARWFNECGRNIGDYEPRLLAIVLRELRHDLRTRKSRNHYLYHHGYNQYYWSEKSREFSRVAEEVYQERMDSGRGVTYIAQYLEYGLRKHERAIEILVAAYQNELLDTKQQIVLCDMWHRQDRHAESIAILQSIVAAAPNTMAYRTRLMTAYARSSRREELRTLLTATDEHFRQQGRWTEAAINQLARCCLDNKLFSEAAGYYGEVIPLHQRSQPNGGIGDRTLSSYYDYQSRAFAGLGDTIKAVDAAAGGVVAWGRRRGNGSGSRHWLDAALLASNDLDGYVEYLDKQVAKTGQDSPLIRQRLGIVYAKRQKHAEAIVQLRLAIELQPTDAETHEALINSYDEINDQDGAVQQTLAMLDFDRHNLELYKKLADRLKSDETLFDRAATTIVEAAPHEAAHHQALAEIRQQQDRWEEAIDHWKHVARLRALEPNGLLKLAEAQLHEERWDGARDSIGQLNQTEWAPRFRQVRSQTEQLPRKLPP